ncbi:hypothetical protein N0V91_005535 [Didymella pomorum]|uniref:Uncharacterized protein n=1 Tax=Didymella pomorum TaxID=749634 RepID=A0A9W9D753_9PLEO|nr:hypothetical protein N0V91_005535 [Didymella pomorum]
MPPPDLPAPTFNLPLSKRHPQHTVSILNYDPSKDYHGQATIEVQTGGSSRKPVNAGNVGGDNLSKVVAGTLDRTCGSQYDEYLVRTVAAEWTNKDTRRMLISIIIRVHLTTDDKGQENYWDIEIWGSPTQFSAHGNLKPCATRRYIDSLLDMYKEQAEQAEQHFPDWKGIFSRDTRVIIDG